MKDTSEAKEDHSAREKNTQTRHAVEHQWGKATVRQP